jgi:hypothetical protein
VQYRVAIEPENSDWVEYVYVEHFSKKRGKILSDKIKIE